MMRMRFVLFTLFVGALTSCSTVPSPSEGDPADSFPASESGGPNPGMPRSGAPNSGSQSSGDGPESGSLAPTAAVASYESGAGVGRGSGASFSAKRSWMTSEELSLWNDPKFKVRFAESYAAETDIEPKITAEDADRLRKFRELMAKDKLQAAEKVIKKGLAQGASAVFDYTLGSLYVQQERLEDAALAYAKAVERFPNFRRAWQNLGLIYGRTSRYESAIPCLIQVIELGGGDSSTYGVLGFSNLNQGNFIAAESAYRMASLLDPGTMDWKIGLARTLFKQERFAEAASLCGTLIEENPEVADLWLMQANAYLGLKQPMRAAENFELVDRLGRSTSESLDLLADIYASEGLNELAAHTYIRAMAADEKGDPEKGIRAAKILSHRSAFAETRLVMREVKSRYGDKLTERQAKDLLHLRARVALSDGAGEEEAKILEEIVEFDPLDGKALILLGEYHERSEAPARAEFYFERAANLEEHEGEAKQKHGQMLVRIGRYAEALPLLKRAQILDPRDKLQEYIEEVKRLAQGTKSGV